jgi:hypothetical protein
MKKYWNRRMLKQIGILAACTILVCGLIIFFTAPSGGDKDRQHLEEELAHNSDILSHQSARPLETEGPAAGLPEASAQTAAPTADPSLAQQPITCIGDSVMLGAAPSIQELFPNCYIDASISRQVWDAPELIESLNSQGLLYPTIILSLGGNGTFKLATGEKVMDDLAGHTVYWVLPYGDSLSWEDSVTSVVRQLDAEYDNLTVFDWPAEAQNHREWFYSDGMHLNAEGQKAYAAFLYRSLTHTEPDA